MPGEGSVCRTTQVPAEGGVRRVREGGVRQVRGREGRVRRVWGDYGE